MRNMLFPGNPFVAKNVMGVGKKHCVKLTFNELNEMYCFRYVSSHPT